MGSVKKNAGGSFGVPRAALSTWFALAAALVLAPAAPASHTGSPEGISVEGGDTLVYHARDAEFNSITVTEDADSYIFTELGTTETGGPLAPVTDNSGGQCAVAGNVTTCQKAGIDSITVFGMGETGDLFLPHDTITADANPPGITTLDGGSGNDDIFGSPGDDVILGGDGIDVLQARDGDDLINTGPSAEDPFFERFEQADGGSGFDTITYADRPSGIRTDFAITGFAIDSDGTSDNLSGGIEKVVGSHFDDEMIGGILSDTFVGNGGNDVMCGGLGIDTVDYSTVDDYLPADLPDSQRGVNVTLDGPMPTDVRHTLPFTSNENVLEYRKARRDCREIVEATGQPIADGERDCTANDGVPGVEQDCVGDDVENIIGSPYDDDLTGNDPDPLEGQGPRIEPHGVNDIDGGGGNDVIDGGFGPDALSGGAGVDTVTYESRAEGVSATIDGAANDGTDTSATDFLVGDFDPRSKLGDSIEGDVENIIGTAHNDVLRGSGAANRLEGGDGDDFIDGGGGHDTILAGPGNDAAVGGNGNDLLLGGDGADVLDGENGDDDVRAEDGGVPGLPEIVKGGAGADALSGGAGHDVLDYSDATKPLSVSLDGLNNDGAAEGDNAAPDFEEVIGGIAADILVGSAGPELLDGGDGDDSLTGAGGADVLIGGAGSDLAAYAERPAPVSVNLAAGTSSDGDVLQGIERVLGGPGDDTLVGDAGDNVLLGGLGNDRLIGGEGNDRLIGDGGDDVMSGGGGDDTLFGSDGDDTLTGEAGNDDLKGEAGNDTLDGGPGADRHEGGPHSDTVLYASRSGGVTVTLTGVDGNGERDENDFINHDVENVTTGSGDDEIDANDNLPGEVKCGEGSDLVTVDPDDDVAGDCENVRVAALGTRCTVQRRTTRMSRTGRIRIRLFCASAARGTVRLRSLARQRVRGKRRIVKIGSRRFSLRAGQNRRITIRASRAARRVIRRKKRLSVRAIVAARPRTQRSTLRTRTVFTVRARR